MTRHTARRKAAAQPDGRNQSVAPEPSKSLSQGYPRPARTSRSRSCDRCWARRDFDQAERPASSDDALVGLCQAYSKLIGEASDPWILHDTRVIAPHRDNLHTALCDSPPTQIVLEERKQRAGTGAKEGHATRIRSRLVSHPCLVISLNHASDRPGEFFQIMDIVESPKPGIGRRMP